MTADARKLPPFATKLAPGDSLVLIYCGRRAWTLAKRDEAKVASLVFPNNRDPAEFKWPVHSMPVLVMALDTADAEVDLLAIELLRAGADIVHLEYRDRRLVTYDLKAPRAQPK